MRTPLKVKPIPKKIKLKPVPKIKTLKCPFCGFTALPTKPTPLEVVCPKCKQGFTAQ